jgi:hypothetical protein
MHRGKPKFSGRSTPYCSRSVQQRLGGLRVARFETSVNQAQRSSCAPPPRQHRGWSTSPVGGDHHSAERGRVLPRRLPRDLSRCRPSAITLRSASLRASPRSSLSAGGERSIGRSPGFQPRGAGVSSVTRVPRRMVKPFHLCRMLEVRCRDIPGFPALRQGPQFIVKPSILLSHLPSEENDRPRFQIPSGTPHSTRVFRRRPVTPQLWSLVLPLGPSNQGSQPPRSCGHFFQSGVYAPSRSCA